MAIRKRSHSSQLLKKRSRDRKLQIVFSTPVLVSAASILIIFLGIYLSGFISKTYEAILQSFYEVTKTIGFQVKTIKIIGMQKTPQNILQNATMLKKGDHILNQDIILMKDRIEQIDWVKKATVTRTFPDTVTIYIEERTPIALWKQSNKYYLVDSEGVVIKSNQIEKYAHLPLVSGEGAAQHIDKTLDVLKHFPDLKKKIKSMIRIRNRRWDIILFKSFVVKLPEDIRTITALETALTQLGKLLNQKRITAESKGYIDLRIPGKIIVSGNLN
jgi:cell division protein FtsQ